jgi:hypothetical protein
MKLLILSSRILKVLLYWSLLDWEHFSGGGQIYIADNNFRFFEFLR